MDIEQIIQELNKKFAQPLPEFYRRRIVVWYDAEREFENAVDQISLNAVRVIKLTGNNNFEVKKIIAVDDTESDILLYNPITYERPDDNWLRDVELYSEEFRADMVSIWMEELHIDDSPNLWEIVKCYRKFFAAKERRERVSKLKVKLNSSGQLVLAIIAAIGNMDTCDAKTIIRKVLIAGLDIGNNAFYADMLKYGAESIFARIVNSIGYNETDMDLRHLATHLLLTATSHVLRTENMAGLEQYISEPHQHVCHEIVAEWMHSDDVESLRKIANNVETDIRLTEVLRKIDISDLLRVECLPCINEVILGKLMADVAESNIDSELIRCTVETRRTLTWYGKWEPIFEALFQVANIQDFYREHCSDGFHIVEPKAIWDAYTTEYYKMDAYYRRFMANYARYSYNADLDDLFKRVVSLVENLYKNWFLGELGTNWSNSAAEQLQKLGYIDGVEKQSGFYDRYIRPAKSRVFVIISDALRYGVATSLEESLKKESLCQVTLRSMQAVFPTITKFGMAALLPHKKLSVELKGNDKTERLVVLADGMSTDAGNRDAVLKAANPKSVVIKASEFKSLKREELNPKLNGMEVVYIYHDTIDEAGHKGDVFTACDTAVREIVDLMKRVINMFRAPNVYVTADHGFLYTRDALTEDEKVDKTSDCSQDIEYGRRYAIMQKGSTPEYLMPVKFLYNDEMDAFAPRENTRIKMRGNDGNFVHGGISLQEMVVPVVECYFLRGDNKELLQNRSKYETKPVTIALLSASRKVSNLIFNLDFYQETLVSDNREKAEYQVYFTDEAGNKICEPRRIIADKRTEDEKQKPFKVSFNLKQGKYSNADIYYLVIADDSGLEVKKIEFQIDIPFATDDFNFFA